MEGDLTDLVRTLIELPSETEWVEFKHNHEDPETIGENLSALANSAALQQEAAYIVWGIEDATHAIVGTTFRPRRKKLGNQELENWLHGHLRPPIDLVIHEGRPDGKPIVLFEVSPARHSPVRFKDTGFIRVGSYTKKLRDHPEKERRLWALLEETAFEEDIALRDASATDVLDLLDYPAYFRLTKQPLPDNRRGILDRLADERLIATGGRGRYRITNLGAILFAHDLGTFGRLARKALRIIKYKGEGRILTEREWSDPAARRGYAAGFESAISFLVSQLPQNEQTGQAFRIEDRMYPEEAIRELVPNALMHQDFAMTGTGPIVEIFDDRMEVTNPGIPLIDTNRFIDAPPRSRNETLASLMRRMYMCEERGSGIDKVVFYVEKFRLPAPDFSIVDGFTKAVLFARRPLSEVDSRARVRACYQHACLRHVGNQRMTNASLRERFAIKPQSASQASRIIKEALGAGMIKLYDPASRPRDRSYVPYWASDQLDGNLTGGDSGAAQADRRARRKRFQ